MLAQVGAPRLAVSGPAALRPLAVATLAAAAPGRFVLGIGTSSNVIVESWNGIPFEEPYQQVQAMVRFLRKHPERLFALR